MGHSVTLLSAVVKWCFPVALFEPFELHILRVVDQPKVHQERDNRCCTEKDFDHNSRDFLFPIIAPAVATPIVPP